MALLGSPSTERRFDPLEFIFVLAIAFGDAILGSLMNLLSGSVGTDFLIRGGWGLAGLVSMTQA